MQKIDYFVLLCIVISCFHLLKIEKNKSFLDFHLVVNYSDFQVKIYIHIYILVYMYRQYINIFILIF